MYSRDISNGEWFNVENEQQFINLIKYGKLEIEGEGSYWDARVQDGKYYGPGKYFLLQYSQKCPKGCCYDSVNEILNEEYAKIELNEKIIEIEKLKQNIEDLKRK